MYSLLDFSSRLARRPSALNCYIRSDRGRLHSSQSVLRLILIANCRVQKHKMHQKPGKFAVMSINLCFSISLYLYCSTPHHKSQYHLCLFCKSGKKMNYCSALFLKNSAKSSNLSFSSPSRVRTLTTFSSISFGPTIKTTGIFISVARRIFLPKESSLRSTS